MRKIRVDRIETECIAVNAGILKALVELVGQDVAFLFHNLEGHDGMEMFNAVLNAIGHIFETKLTTETVVSITAFAV